jgi:mannose-6-phosphate isomerase-like protein (cupin superfamily)
MKKAIVGVAVGCLMSLSPCVTSLNARGDNPQPTCHMCPGVYVPNDEIQAYVKKAIAEKRIDQQVRDVEIGKSNVAIGLVYRGKLDSPAPDSVAEHDQVSEVYHVIDGSGTLMLGPDIVGFKPDERGGAPAQRTGGQWFIDPQRYGLSTQGWRHGHYPGRHRALVHENRRPHHVHHGAHRSRQGNADEGRGRVKGLSCRTAPLMTQAAD